MYYAGLRVRREIVIHVLFGRTKISYPNTLDIKQSFDLYVRSSGHTTPRVLKSYLLASIYCQTWTFVCVCLYTLSGGCHIYYGRMVAQSCVSGAQSS